MSNLGNSREFVEQWAEAVENARQHAKGWQQDKGEGILDVEELSVHASAGCLVCARWDRWDNVTKRPGEHEIITEDGS